MTESASAGSPRIDDLLASRQQISDWIDRLRQSDSKVPQAVRDRVQSDYDARLAAVVDQLREHSSSISGTLTGLRVELADREREQAVERESLAEAELRYTVGEYSESEWQSHEARCGTRLEELGGAIHRLGGEIARLEDVLAQIAGAPSPATAHSPAAADTPLEVEREEVAIGEVVDNYQLESHSFITIEDAPADPRTQSVFDSTSAFPTAPDPAMEPLEPAPAAPEAPRFTPRSGAIPPRPRTSAAHKAVDDELAFLKSVTSEPVRAAAPDLKVASAPAAVATKTLKCQDCGTLNRPTEWYCERCGAELSAV